MSLSAFVQKCVRNSRSRVHEKVHRPAETCCARPRIARPGLTRGASWVPRRPLRSRRTDRLAERSAPAAPNAPPRTTAAPKGPPRPNGPPRARRERPGPRSRPSPAGVRGRRLRGCAVDRSREPVLPCRTEQARTPTRQRREQLHAPRRHRSCQSRCRDAGPADRRRDRAGVRRTGVRLVVSLRVSVRERGRRARFAGGGPCCARRIRRAGSRVVTRRSDALDRALQGLRRLRRRSHRERRPGPGHRRPGDHRRGRRYRRRYRDDGRLGRLLAHLHAAPRRRRRREPHLRPHGRRARRRRSPSSPRRR